MKIYLYGYMNCLGNFFGKPFSTEFDKEDYVEIFTQSLFSAPKQTLESLVDNDLYYFGEFDTVTGAIVPCKDFVAHLNDIINPVLIKKGFKEDGRQEENNA